MPSNNPTTQLPNYLTTQQPKNPTTQQPITRTTTRTRTIPNDPTTQQPNDLPGHIILCGLGKIGYSILELLHTLEEPVTVVTRDVHPDWRLRTEALADRLIMGDAR